MKGKINAAIPLCTVIIYLLLGFCFNLWHPGWVIFLLIPVTPMLLGKKTLRGIFPLLTGVIYVLLGIIWGLWHPGWIIFLTIPVVEIFLSPNEEYEDIE